MTVLLGHATVFTQYPGWPRTFELAGSKFRRQSCVLCSWTALWAFSCSEPTHFSQHFCSLSKWASVAQPNMVYVLYKIQVGHRQWSVLHCWDLCALTWLSWWRWYPSTARTTRLPIIVGMYSKKAYMFSSKDTMIIVIKINKKNENWWADRMSRWILPRVES